MGHSSSEVRGAIAWPVLAAALCLTAWAGCSELGATGPGPAAGGGVGTAGAGVGGSGATGASTSTANGGTTAAGGQGGSGLAPLPCDQGFSFSANPATVGVAFDASFTADDGYAYVDMEVSGAGSPVSTWQGMAGGPPYTWTWQISGHGNGVLDFTFVRDKDGGPGTPVASCQIYSLGQGGSGGGSGGAGAAGGSGPGPPLNRYGMGYANHGYSDDHDRTAALAGPGGFVLVIFADIEPNRHSADASWQQSISEAYARDLIPVIRMAPPWGDRNVRNMGESPTSYLALATTYREVIADLPLRADWPIYVQVHNEPNLCYEWECDSGTLTDQQTAGEYAHMLSDVADALHAMNDPRVRVVNGPLAPGGVGWCECGTSNWGGGTLATTFLQYMAAAVPGVFDKVDTFGSHSYPAGQAGSNFFPPYSQAMPGLLFFEQELAAINKPNLGVLITETGWTIQHESYNHTRQQVADWTVQALQNVWLTHPNIVGITPFLLRDAAWNNFAWVQVGGTPYPVYNDVRAYRCSQPNTGNCP